MVPLLLLSWSLIGAGTAQATTLPTTITENTTLTLLGSPYSGGSVTVAPGVTLTVDPGVEVTTTGGLSVEGTLKAEGEALKPVILRPYHSSITFKTGSGASVLDYVEVPEGGWSGSSTSEIEIKGSSPTITHSTLRKSAYSGISVGGGSPTIAYNSILGAAGNGVIDSFAAGNEIKIHDNLIEGSGNTAIFVSGNGAGAGSTLGNNTIKGSKGSYGIYYSVGEKGVVPPDIANNVLSGNNGNTIAFSGTLTESATWKNPGFPLLIQNGSFAIAKNATLTLAPGIDLGGGAINVEGTLKAEGEALKPVILRPYHSSITFKTGSGASVLDYVEVPEGGWSGSSTSEIEIKGSSPTITHSTLRKSAYSGISVGGGSPTIAYNSILGAAYSGIVYTAGGSETGEVNIHNNLVEGGTRGIFVEIWSTGSVVGKSLSSNTVKGTSSGTALGYKGPDIPGDVTENTLEGNVSNEIQVSGTVGHSETWRPGGSPVQFTGSGVVIPVGVTLNLEPGVYLRSPKTTVYGTLHAAGTSTHPVAFTGTSEEKGGEWGGVNFEAGSGSSLLNYVEIAYGGAGTPMLNVKGVSPTIINSTFRRSAGDAMRVQQSGHPVVEGNRFRNNQFGLRYEGEGKLSAPRNDWGCANGPKPTGCGDEATANVEWQPAAVLQELPRLCPGTTMSASSFQCLLQKYEPALRYDSEENYFADDAREIAENWGDGFSLWGTTEFERYSNKLFDKDYETGEANGKLIGESRPSGEGEYRLTMGLLGGVYPNSLPADSNDWLDENDNYLADSARLEASGFMNSAYGYGTTDSNGKRWLEYWYWYYYNPKNWEGIGQHEGDWESVLIGLDSNNQPDSVILSQHTGAARCTIEQLELTAEGAPIVFVGVGSHANYPLAGTYAAPSVSESDYADGIGAEVRPGLVNLNTYLPGWTAWPGHWGNSKPDFVGEATSPQGPVFHEAWGVPGEYAESAGECLQGFESVEVPFPHSGATETAAIQSVVLKGHRPLVSYEVRGADGQGFWPRLRITVNDLDDGGLPGRSTTISNVKAHGELTLPFPVQQGHVAEVLGSIVYKSGRRVHLTPKTVHSP